MKIILLWLQGCGILVPQPGIESTPLALEAQSLNHWPAREVPHFVGGIVERIKHWVIRKAIDYFGHIDSCLGNSRYDDIDDNNVLSRFSHVQLYATLWTVAPQTPLSVGFPRPEN